MAELYVRDVPDELYERLQVRAKVMRRSVSDEVIDLLRRELGFSRRDVKEILASIDERNRLNPPPAGLPDAVEVIRKDRAR